MRTLLTTPLLLLTLALPAAAQSRWKQVGKTASGNSVYIQPRSVKRAAGIITARVRVLFTTPVQTPQGPWKSAQVVAMFNCAKSTIAAKESWYYADNTGTKVVQHTVNKEPGYGPAIGGSMTQVVMDYFCKKKS